MHESSEICNIDKKKKKQMEELFVLPSAHLSVPSFIRSISVEDNQMKGRTEYKLSWLIFFPFLF